MAGGDFCTQKSRRKMHTFSGAEFVCKFRLRGGQP